MTEVLRQLGRYELLKRIAQGGMGEIFVARMRGAAGFEKRVIIKTILEHLAAEPEFVTKFLDEGRIVVQLTHGNIVPVFDMGEQDGEYFIAMEYIPGRDLRDIVKRLERQGTLLPVEMSLHIVSEVCKGLDYAHRKLDERGDPLELVHRDVSPSNVLISREGEVKIIDFGIARATNKLSQTVTGRIQGKFCYMSPQQAAGKSVDARSDIFSTGVMLYEMLTGVRPFEGRTDLESVDLVRRCEFDLPSVINPRVPKEVDEILARAMSKDLEARYQSIDRMQIDLLQYLYTHGCAPTSHDVAVFLEDVFTEGIEKREMRPSASATARDEFSGPRRLDDVLEAELDRLSGGPGHTPSVEIDPLTSTALSDRGAARPDTATLMTGREALHSPKLVDPHDDRATTREELIKIPANTAERLEVAETLEELPTDLATPPLSGGDPSSAPEAQAPEAASPPRGSDDAGAPEEAAPEDGGAAPQAAAPEPSGGEGRRRVWLGAGVAAALLVAGLGALAWSSTRPGRLQVRTDPPGARVIVDGVTLSEVRTPHTLELEPGSHTVRLKLEGRTPPGPFRVEIRPGQTTLLEGGEVALGPAPAPTKPTRAREILVRTDPPGASLSADGRALGPAPQRVSLSRERGPIVVYARRPGCQDEDVTLSPKYVHDEHTIRLSCEEEPGQTSSKGGDEAPPARAEAEVPTRDEVRRPAGPRRVRVAIKTRPAEALISVNGQPPRPSPLIQSYPAGEPLEVRVSHEGYQSVERTLRPGQLEDGTWSVTLEPEPTGCLNLRLMNPQLAEVFIDGDSIGQVQSKRRGLKLPAGPHRVRVYNRAAGREEEATVEIQPGAECLTRVFFEEKG